MQVKVGLDNISNGGRGMTFFPPQISRLLAFCHMTVYPLRSSYKSFISFPLRPSYVFIYLSTKKSIQPILCYQNV